MSRSIAGQYARRWFVLLELEHLGIDVSAVRGHLKRVEQEEADEVLYMLNDEQPLHVKGFLIFPDDSVRVMSMNQGTWHFDNLARCMRSYPGVIEYLRVQTDMEARRDGYAADDET